MAVNIPVSANASGAVSEIKKITDAITRAGQAGREFSKLNLSHPELRDFADQIRAIGREIERLNHATGTTAAVSRRVWQASGGRLNDYFSEAAWRQMRPDDFHRRFQTAQANVWNGATSAGLPVPYGASRPGAAGGGGIPIGSGGGWFGGGAGIGQQIGGSTWGAARSFGVAMMTASGLQGVFGTVTHAARLGQQDAIGTDTLMRRMGGLAASFDLLRESIHKTSEGLGITYADAQRLSASWARLTNESSPEALARGVRNMVGFARAGGGDVDTVTHQGAIAARYGLDTQRFATIVGDVMVRANMRAQQEDAGGALTRFMDRMVATGNDPGQAAAFAAAFANLNAANPNSRWGAGEGILSRADSTFQGGGGRGMASRAFLEGVLRRRGITDPFEQQYYIEGGMFGALPGGGTFGAAALADFDRVNPSANRFQRISGISGIFGGRMREAQQVVDALRGGALPGQGISDAGDTEGRRTQQNLANLENSLTEVGRQLLPAVNLLTEGVTALTGGVAELTGLFRSAVSAFSEGGLGGLGQAIIGGVAGPNSGPARLFSLARGQGDPGSGNAPGEDITAEQGAQRARFIYDEGIRRGLTHTQAMAVVAQAHGESGFRAGARGDSGRSHGVFQHDAARRAAMERQFGLPPGGYSTASFEDQVRMSYWEMLESPGSDNVGARLRGTRTSAEANDVLVNGWERPADRAGAVAARTSITDRLSNLHRQNPNFGLPAIPPAPAPGAAVMTPGDARIAELNALSGGVPGATPAPAGGGGPGGGGDSTTRMVVDPLRVTVQNADGTTREELELPIRPAPGSPRPYGAPRYSTGGGF